MTQARRPSAQPRSRWPWCRRKTREPQQHDTAVPLATPHRGSCSRRQPCWLCAIVV